MRHLVYRPKANVQAEIDRSYLGQLPTICLVIFCYFSFISIAHFFFLPYDILYPVVTTSIMAAGSALFVRALAKKGLISAAKSHYAFIPVGMLVFITVYTHVYLSEDQLQLTNAVMLLYGYGLVTLSRKLYAVYMTFAISGYIFSLVALGGPFVVHLAFMFVAVTVLSIMGFMVRYHTLVNMARVLVFSRSKTQRLARVTKEMAETVEKVQAANAAKDIFLANITHELRTPLTGVIGMLDFLKPSAVSKDQVFMVDTARRSADYLLNIVNDLLDLSKMDAGKLALRLHSVDLVTLTRDTVETFRGQATAKNISLQFLVEEGVAYQAQADEIRLSQILLNLISNAVKFTDTGGVTVSLCLEADKVVWRISDTGAGISKEQAEKLFKRFEQLDSSKTRKTSGTGLGLSIVSELISLMSGTITLENTESGGACFVAKIPFTVECIPLKTLTFDDAEQEISLGEAKVSYPEEKPEACSEMSSLAHLNLRALVAEDNQINQMLITKIMQHMGIDITLVENGQLAVEAVKEASKPFDLIFMDIQMPVMDGLTAMDELAKAGNTIPVIALTANTHPDNIAEYEAVGMAGFIGKPINLEDCFATIAKVVQKT